AGARPRAGTPRGARSLPPAGTGVSAAGRGALALAMSLHAGVIRDRDGLERLLTTLERAPDAGGAESPPVQYLKTGEAPQPARGPDLETVRATNLHTVSVLVAGAALARAESRGCHRRRDAPGARARAHHTLARCDEARLGVWLDAAPGRPAVAGAVTGAGARCGAAP
ncbi:MAG: hypothetical protein JO242_16075, partial [Streptosporangiaceae bacterium]|nr:hypothetical protein [Streptosporangiaceae bacterium]